MVKKKGHSAIKIKTLIFEEQTTQKKKYLSITDVILFRNFRKFNALCYQNSNVKILHISTHFLQKIGCLQKVWKKANFVKGSQKDTPQILSKNLKNANFVKEFQKIKNFVKDSQKTEFRERMAENSEFQQRIPLSHPPHKKKKNVNFI